MSQREILGAYPDLEAEDLREACSPHAYTFADGYLFSGDQPGLGVDIDGPGGSLPLPAGAAAGGAAAGRHDA